MIASPSLYAGMTTETPEAHPTLSPAQQVPHVHDGLVGIELAVHLHAAHR